MSNTNAGFTVSFFDTGRGRGLNIYFYSKPGDVQHKSVVHLDISQFYQKGMIKQIGSIRVLNQYATIGIKDITTNISTYAAPSVQACFPLNSTTQKLEIWRHDNLASATSFDMVIYEDVIPPYALGAPLP
jgi:hypothetical protein